MTIFSSSALQFQKHGLGFTVGFFSVLIITKIVKLLFEIKLNHNNFYFRLVVIAETLETLGWHLLSV